MSGQTHAKPAARSASRLRRLVERDMATLEPGARRGWWLREALDHEPGMPCPPPTGDETADVVVVGGGFTGLWTAWWLLQRDPALGYHASSSATSWAGARAAATAAS